MKKLQFLNILLYTFANVIYKNQDNAGGIPMVVYFAEHKDIDVFPVETTFDEITTPESAATLTGIPIMKTGKYFYKLEVTENKGSIVAKGVGEVGGRSTKPELKVQLDGVTETTAGLNRLFQNGRFMFLVPNINKAFNYQVVGYSKFNPATLKDSELTSGEGTEAKRGTTFTFESGAKTLQFLNLTDEQLEVLLGNSNSGSGA